MVLLDYIFFLLWGKISFWSKADASIDPLCGPMFNRVKYMFSGYSNGRFRLILNRSFMKEAEVLMCFKAMLLSHKNAVNSTQSIAVFRKHVCVGGWVLTDKIS